MSKYDYVNTLLIFIISFHKQLGGLIHSPKPALLVISAY